MLTLKNLSNNDVLWIFCSKQRCVPIKERHLSIIHVVPVHVKNKMSLFVFAGTTICNTFSM